MEQGHILSILYEMALAIGGEVSVKPLLAKTLQRLLYHTSFPAGFVCLDMPAMPADAAGMVEVRIDAAVGDYELSALVGSKVRLPARLLLGKAERAEDAALLAALPDKTGPYTGYLRLPIEGEGVIVLLAPELPDSDLPLTQLFQPLMANLAKAIVLCRSHDAYTGGLIAARDASQQALAASEEKFRTLSAAVIDALIMVDDEGVLVYWNPAAERILGYRAEEALGKPMHALLTPARYRDAAMRGFDKFRGTGQGAVVGKTIEIEALHKAGHEFPIELSISALKLNERWHAVGLLRDITVKKRLEEDLRQASVYNRSLIEASLDPLVTISAEGKITDVNRATEAATGRTRDELIGTDFSVYFTEPERARAGYRQVFQEGAVTDYPLALRHRNGHVTDVLYNASVYRGEGGAVLGVFAAARDITERKRAENELRERDRHTQSLLRLSRNLERSQTYAEVMNAARDEVRDIIGYQNLWAYLISDDRLSARALMAGGPLSEMVMSEQGSATLFIKGDRMLEEIANAKEIVIVEDARADERVNREVVERLGNRTIVNVPIVLFDRHLGTIGTGTFGDEGVHMPTASEQGYLMALASHMAVALDRIHLLNERQKAETELREREAFLSTIIENIPAMIFLKEAVELRFVRFNRAGEELLGYRREDLLGKNDYDFFPREQADFFTQKDREVLAGGRLHDVPEEPIDTKSGHRILHTRKLPILDRNGAPAYLLGISEDITERKRAELEIQALNRDLERRVADRTAQLEAANKELEAFAYSVSHDLRTPLRAIDGFSRILLEDYAGRLDEEGRRLFGVVRDNAMRMNQLIDDILKFSRAGRLDLSLVDVDVEKMARDIVAELRAGIPEADLKIEIEALPKVRADNAMLRQVLVNLVSNAIKFSRQRKPAVIRIGGSVQGGEAVYYVRDNGAGFDMQYANKLFGVFQRLHSESEFEGTGIGLAIVKRIVTRHGGRVWAEGKVGEGATLYFALPYSGESGG